jgi:L-lactate permease
MFHQVLKPTGNLLATWLIALIPVVPLLFLLAGLSAWLAALIGSLVTLVLGIVVSRMPVGAGITSHIYCSLTGIWAVDWITFREVVLFNRLIVTGVFEKFRQWLTAQATADVRVQRLLFAWAFGALLEGLVGFGHAWAVVAPMLIALGTPDLDAIRVAAIANNAPVSYGALGVPIIALAAVTGLPSMQLSSSVGHVVAVLALLPPLGTDLSGERPGKRIGVALSGSDTSTNAMFGAFQTSVGKLLGLPLLLLPSLNSCGGRQADRTADDKRRVSTSKFVRSEGEIIRHNMNWTLILLGYLILIGLLYYFVFPGVM